MKRLTRLVSGVGAIALLLALMQTTAAGPAGASLNPTIVVTTTSDVIDGSDGLVSLREAIDEANQTAGPDTIQLADGATYDLTTCGDTGNPSSTNNAVGDLNANDLGGLTVHGSGATIVQPCASRVLLSLSGPLTLDHLFLSGGDSIIGGSLQADGPLTLDHVDISGAAKAFGTLNSDGVVYSAGRPVSIVDSTIHDNLGTGIFQVGGDGATRANFTITNSTVRDNVVGPDFSRAAGIDSLGPLTLDGSTISGNRNSSGSTSGVGGVTSPDLLVKGGSTISGNQGYRAGGLLGTFEVIDSEVLGNTSWSDGGGGSGSFTIVRSVIADNQSSYSGGGLTGTGSVTASTVADNSAASTTVLVPGIGGGIAVVPAVAGPAPALTVTNSTITGNEGALGGGIAAMNNWTNPPGTVVPADVVLESSTVVGNISRPNVDYGGATELGFAHHPGEPAIDVVGSLSLHSTVLGTAPIARPVCLVSAASSVTSGGYNFTADSSCGLGAGTGDLVAAGDPGLGSLGANGGPTPTMEPTGESPLVEQVPLADAGCTGAVDQRGVTRPQGTACDIGAVELDAASLPVPAEFTAVVPRRLMDTRANPAYHVGTGTRFGPSTRQDLVVTGSTTTVPSDATAVVVNVTAVDPTDASHLDVWPAGQSQPNVSNLNFVAGATVPNLVKVKVGTGNKISLFNRNGSVDVIVDVVGYYRPDPLASRFTPLPPVRVVDTRSDPAYHIGPLNRFGDRNDTRTLIVTGPTVPLDATAVMANVTVVAPSTSSHLDVWPAGEPHPNVSNLNYVAGQTVPNLVVVKIGSGGAIDLQNQNGSTDVIVDIVGYFRVDPTAAGYVATRPHRVIDTRSDPAYHVGSLSRFGDHTVTRSLEIIGPSAPPGAKAVVANITVVDPTGSSHLDVWPAGDPHPNVSNLNYVPGLTVANLVVVKIGAGGAIDLQNQNGSTDVIIDIVGYYR